jgi:regulator of cell morphogenesis and NO signaling
MKSVEVDWTQASLTELVDHIVNTHHAYLKRELPLLSELTTTILRVHGPNHGELFQVHKLFHTFKMDMEQHMMKEEDRGFKLMKEYEQNPAGQIELLKNTVNNHMLEHDTAVGTINELRKVTQNYAVPEDACGTFSMTFKKLEELEADLLQHVHLENDILFSKIQAL